MLVILLFSPEKRSPTLQREGGVALTGKPLPLELFAGRIWAAYEGAVLIGVLCDRIARFGEYGVISGNVAKPFIRF